MNKFLKLFVAFFVMATLSFSFVSCGDDEEPTPDPDPQPEEEVTYTVYYLAAIARDNFNIGTVEFSALDPVSNKTVSYTLPDNGSDDWDNKAYSNIVSLYAGNIDKNVYMLRCVAVSNVKKGMNYSASATLKLDKSKIEALDKNKTITVHDVTVIPHIIDSKGYPYLSSMSFSLSSSEYVVSDLLDNFEQISTLYPPVIVSGTIK